MAELFGVEVHTINYHLKEIFKSGELAEDAVIRKFRITAAEIIATRRHADLKRVLYLLPSQKIQPKKICNDHHH